MVTAKPLGLEHAVIVGGSPAESLRGLRSTSLAVWKRQSPSKMAEATLLLPLDASRPESWRAAEAVLRRLHRITHPPRLFLHFRNALSAGSWLQEDETALSEREVGEWLQGLGWHAAQRQAVTAQQEGNGLAPATSQALDQLFRQLKPSTAAHYWLWRVEVGAPPKSAAHDPHPVPGRLSVILELGPSPHLDELDRTLFALGCQAHRSVEWVVCGSYESTSVRSLLGRHRKLSGVSRLLRAGDLNEGLEQATGQYLAFATPGMIVYPSHYARQIERIASSNRAWSWAAARQVDLESDSSGGLHVATKRTLPHDDRLEPLSFARERVALYAAVIDRKRLGTFDLRFDETSSSARFLSRLTALFEPLYTAGLPELELRGEQPVDSTGVQGISVLRSADRWSQSLELARDQVRGSGVRRQFVDRLNEALKRRMPGLHQRMKQLAQSWLPGEKA